MGNPVVHFEIGGSDRAALQGFYNHLFDWKIESNDSMEYSFVSPGGEGSIGGGICGAPSDAPVKNWVTFYVQVENVQAYLDKAETLGGKTLLPVTPVPGMGEFAWFSDPQGNCIGLWSNAA